MLINHINCIIITYFYRLLLYIISISLVNYNIIYFCLIVF